MSKTISKDCIGCGRRFLVLDVSNDHANFCTEKCKKSHTIFMELRKKREG